MLTYSQKITKPLKAYVGIDKYTLQNLGMKYLPDMGRHRGAPALGVLVDHMAAALPGKHKADPLKNTGNLRCRNPRPPIVHAAITRVVTLTCSC